LTKTITHCQFEKIVLSTTFHTIFVMSPLLGAMGQKYMFWCR
jgi:hypothetical protein